MEEHWNGKKGAIVIDINAAGVWLAAMLHRKVIGLVILARRLSWVYFFLGCFVRVRMVVVLFFLRGWVLGLGAQAQIPAILVRGQALLGWYGVMIEGLGKATLVGPVRRVRSYLSLVFENGVFWNFGCMGFIWCFSLALQRFLPLLARPAGVWVTCRSLRWVLLYALWRLVGRFLFCVVVCFGFAIIFPPSAFVYAVGWDIGEVRLVCFFLLVAARGGWWAYFERRGFLTRERIRAVEVLTVAEVRKLTYGPRIREWCAFAFCWSWWRLVVRAWPALFIAGVFFGVVAGGAFYRAFDVFAVNPPSLLFLLKRASLWLYKVCVLNTASLFCFRFFSGWVVEGWYACLPWFSNGLLLRSVFTVLGGWFFCKNRYYMGRGRLEAFRGALYSAVRAERILMGRGLVCFRFFFSRFGCASIVTPSPFLFLRYVVGEFLWGVADEVWGFSLGWLVIFNFGAERSMGFLNSASSLGWELLVNSRARVVFFLQDIYGFYVLAPILVARHFADWLEGVLGVLVAFVERGFMMYIGVAISCGKVFLGLAGFILGLKVFLFIFSTGWLGGVWSGRFLVWRVALFSALGGAGDLLYQKAFYVHFRFRRDWFRRLLWGFRFVSFVLLGVFFSFGRYTGDMGLWLWGVALFSSFFKVAFLVPLKSFALRVLRPVVEVVCAVPLWLLAPLGCSFFSWSEVFFVWVLSPGVVVGCFLIRVFYRAFVRLSYELAIIEARLEGDMGNFFLAAAQHTKRARFGFTLFRLGSKPDEAELEYFCSRWHALRNLFFWPTFIGFVLLWISVIKFLFAPAYSAIYGALLFVLSFQWVEPICRTWLLALLRRFKLSQIFVHSLMYVWFMLANVWWSRLFGLYRQGRGSMGAVVLRGVGFLAFWTFWMYWFFPLWVFLGWEVLWQVGFFGSDNKMDYRFAVWFRGRTAVALQQVSVNVYERVNSLAVVPPVEKQLAVVVFRWRVIYLTCAVVSARVAFWFARAS